jgi:hypothetical protein
VILEILHSRTRPVSICLFDVPEGLKEHQRRMKEHQRRLERTPNIRLTTAWYFRFSETLYFDSEQSKTESEKTQK